jgi:hypothetical protein
MRRLSLALALAVPTARAARTGPFLAAAGVGLALAGVPSALAVTLLPDSLALLLRLAACCAAVGVLALFDDPAKPTTAVLPGPAWVGIGLRVAGAAGAVAVWWAVTVAVVLAGAENGTGARLPVPGTTLEAATIVTLGVVFGVIGRRIADRGVASPVAAPALLLVLAAIALLPHRVALFVGVDDPSWSAAHDRWAVLLLGAVLAVVLGAA